LDLGKVLIQWNGPNCSIAEKSRVSMDKRHTQHSVFAKKEIVLSVCTVTIG